MIENQTEKNMDNEMEIQGPVEGLYGGYMIRARPPPPPPLWCGWGFGLGFKVQG